MWLAGWALALVLGLISQLGDANEIHPPCCPATETPVPVSSPTPTVVPAPEPTAPVAVSDVVYGHVTHYGSSYEGLPLGCPGYGVYRSADPTIAASAYNLATGARPYQCGDQLEVCGTAACAVVVVKDACPGCGWNHLDLSEAGQALICGFVGNNCSVSIRLVGK